MTVVGRARSRIPPSAARRLRPASQKLSGTAPFEPTTNDVDDCLKTKPPNLTIDPDEAVDPSAVSWSASFDGTTAKGSIALDPKTPFEATREE
jgi:hypothetical protein